MTDDLRKSGIAPERAAKLCWRPVNASEYPALLGISAGVARKLSDGYLVPFPDPVTGRPMLTPDGRLYVRVKLRVPASWRDPDSGAKSKVKYLSPKDGGQHAYVLPEVHRALMTGGAVRVLVTEGEKKSVAATDAGIPTIGLVGNWGWLQPDGDGEGLTGDALLPELRQYLGIRDWHVVWDSDAVGNEAFDLSSARLATVLAASGCRLVRTDMPSLGRSAKVGIDDFLANPGSTPDMLREYLQREQRPVRPLAVLHGEGVEVREMARSVADAVVLRCGIFNRDGEVILLSRTPTVGYACTVVTQASARSIFEDYCQFVRYRGGSGDRRLHPAVLSEQDTRAIIGAPHFVGRLPAIKAIADYRVPVCRNGTVELSLPGFDAATGIWTNPDGPEVRLLDSVAEAIRVLHDILADFAFAGDSSGDDAPSRATAVAYLISPHVRFLFMPQRAPIFYASANQEGVGKDYLLGLGPLIATGEYPDLSSPLRDPEETRKRLFAAARSGTRFMIVSNQKGHLDDPSLEAAATAPALLDRLMGQNRTQTVPNTPIYAISGNGLTMSPDLARRCVEIRLEYLEEDVQRRTFSHPDLYGYVLSNRPLVLSALATLVDHWIRAGRPAGSRSMASFVRWAAIVGGIMESCGLPNPLVLSDSASSLSGRVDERTEHLKKLLFLWYNAHGLEAVLTTDLRALADENELFGWCGCLRERPAQTAFGKMLKSYLGRWFSYRDDAGNGVFDLRAVEISGHAKPHYRLEQRAPASLGRAA